MSVDLATIGGKSNVEDSNAKRQEESQQAYSRIATNILTSSTSKTNAPDLRIFHYNDVYHVEAGSKDPVGGAARFQTLWNYYAHDACFTKQPDLLTFFSGDAFNPSLESTVTKGKHMVPVLNDLRTDAACLGNHDLDFGVEQFEYLAKKCNFPWLCANVLDPSLGENIPLGRCKRTAIVSSSNGIKVGLIGLVEREWLDTINFLPADLDFRSPSDVARELAPQLRAQGAEIIIVLAHQRMPNDIQLAQQLEPGIVDVILGGHDHTYEYATVNGTVNLRSGTDFKQFSYIEARRITGRTGWEFDILRRDVLSAVPQDATCLATISKITAALSAKLDKPVGCVAAPLDARFTTVRMAESNIGNLVSDIMRYYYGAECALMCGGTIRGDQVYPPGILKVKDIMDCFPFEDTCVVVELSGETIVEALENGVSKWPALDGRFPQVSGISLAFDPSRPPGSRCSDVKINGQPVDRQREYSMVTRDYMCHGKDGFHMLRPHEEGGKVRITVPDESGMMLSMLLRQYFMSLKVTGRWRNWGQSMGRHWRGIHGDLHEKHPVRDAPTKEEVKSGAHGETAHGLAEASVPRNPHPRVGNKTGDSFELSDSEDEASSLEAPPSHADQAAEQERKLALARKVVRKWWRFTGKGGHPGLVEEPGDGFSEYWARAVAPRVEGRIRQISGTSVH